MVFVPCVQISLCLEIWMRRRMNEKKMQVQKANLNNVSSFNSLGFWNEYSFNTWYTFAHNCLASIHVIVFMKFIEHKSSYSVWLSLVVAKVLAQSFLRTPLFNVLVNLFNTFVFLNANILRQVRQILIWVSKIYPMKPKLIIHKHSKHGITPK